jgi:hypothetical protein
MLWSCMRMDPSETARTWSASPVCSSSPAMALEGMVLVTIMGWRLHPHPEGARGFQLSPPPAGDGVGGDMDKAGGATGRNSTGHTRNSGTIIAGRHRG